MEKSGLNYDDLIEIVRLIEASSQFAELHLKVGDVEIELKAKRAGRREPPEPADRPAQAPVQGGEVSNDIAIARLSPAPGASPALALPEDAVLVRSPMVGTFYRAPEPGAQPFVSVGSRVTADTTVCIIEVMKLMSSIPAEASGLVTHILVDDAKLVEAEQVLMVIDPKA